MSTVDSPVTQMTETAVNSASTNGACWPDAVAIGSENRIVNDADQPGEDQDGEPRRGAEGEVADRVEHARGKRLVQHGPDGHLTSLYCPDRGSIVTLGYGRYLRRARRRNASRSCSPASSGTQARSSVYRAASTELGISQPTVSKHLKVLREHGLVTVRDEGQHRYYRLDGRRSPSSSAWLAPFVAGRVRDRRRRMSMPRRPCSPRGRAPTSAIASVVRRRSRALGTRRARGRAREAAGCPEACDGPGEARIARWPGRPYSEALTSVTAVT